MKKTLLALLSSLFMSLAIGQATNGDSVKITYYFKADTKYQKDVLPACSLFLKLDKKKYLLGHVNYNDDLGDAQPTISYNKKAKRNEYIIKIWWAGTGTDYKAYTTGTREAHTHTVMVYAMDRDEMIPVNKEKWRLVKAIKLL